MEQDAQESGQVTTELAMTAIEGHTTGTSEESRQAAQPEMANTQAAAEMSTAEQNQPVTQQAEGIQPDVEALTQELEAARQEAAQNYERFLRVYAEMDNYKKRIEQTYANLARQAKKNLLLKLLDVKDNLERAISYGNAQQPAESLLQGVRLTEYQLDQLLRSEGVAPIELEGKPFNPQQAEAVSTVVDPNVPDHTIAQEVQRGYMYQDEVLRPAKVVVAVQQPNEPV
jgi:molecular chaperone GrpE